MDGGGGRHGGGAKKDRGLLPRRRGGVGWGAVGGVRVHSHRLTETVIQGRENRVW